MIIGTAGHIDHGKTALVRALTGVDTDRLPEEKARGISIDLGFAYKTLPGGQALGFVDVPGHVRFIHNMLAGATGIDFVLLVIAANDGPMPQTREHLAIIDLLGIRRGIVALTKCDLVDSTRRAGAAAEIGDLLAATPFKHVDVVPVSSVTREGLDALEARLIAEAARPTRHRTGGRFRMAVDRRFVLAGAGTVVSGTVFAGRVAVGDEVVVTPAGLNARVRGLHAHNAPAAGAAAGQRCALNLSGPAIAVDRIRRGDWIVAPALHRPTDRLDARLRLLAGETRALRHWAPVHLHIGTAHGPARVALLEGQQIAPGAEGLVQIVVDRPIAALAGDRLVLRDPAARQTVGGGIVLDPWPPNRGRRRPERRQFLAALAAPTTEDAIDALMRSEPGWVEMARFGQAWNLSEDEAGAMTARLTARALAVPAGPFLVSSAVWSGLRQSVVDALERHHAAAPDAPGLEVERLHRALPKRYPPELLTAAVETLRRERFIEQNGPWFCRRGHSARLSAADQKIWDRVRPLLDAPRFSPPRVRDLAAALKLREDVVRGLLRRLVRVGAVVEIAHDHFYPRPAVAALAALAEQTAAAADGATLATNEYRDRIGTGRKVAIQILEFFDRSGLTLRRGDTRLVRKDKLSLFGAPGD